MSVAWQGWPVPARLCRAAANGQRDRQRRHRWRSCWERGRSRPASSSHATGHVTGKKQVGGLTGVFTQGSGTGLTTSWASGRSWTGMIWLAD